MNRFALDKSLLTMKPEVERGLEFAPPTFNIPNREVGREKVKYEALLDLILNICSPYSF